MFLVYEETFKNVKPVTLQTQSDEAEKQIKQEFEMLHQFLNNEEAARIAALKNEEEKKKQMLREKVEKINRDITSLNELIQSVAKQMSDDNLFVLQVWNLFL